MADNFFRVTLREDGVPTTQYYTPEEYEGQVVPLLSSDKYKKEDYDIVNFSTADINKLNKNDWYRVSVGEGDDYQEEYYTGDDLISNGKLQQIKEAFPNGGFNIHRAEVLNGGQTVDRPISEAEKAMFNSYAEAVKRNAGIAAHNVGVAGVHGLMAGADELRYPQKPYIGADGEEHQPGKYDKVQFGKKPEEGSESVPVETEWNSDMKMEIPTRAHLMSDSEIKSYANIIRKDDGSELTDDEKRETIDQLTKYRDSIRSNEEYHRYHQIQLWEDRSKPKNDTFLTGLVSGFQSLGINAVKAVGESLNALSGKSVDNDASIMFPGENDTDYHATMIRDFAEKLSSNPDMTDKEKSDIAFQMKLAIEGKRMEAMFEDPKSNPFDSSVYEKIKRANMADKKIFQALLDSNGDIAKAKALLTNKSTESAIGETVLDYTQKWESNVPLPENVPAKIGSFTSGIIPFVIGGIVGLKNPKAGAAISNSAMGVMVASGAGSAMEAARHYGASDSQILSAGLATAAIEYGVLKLGLQQMAKPSKLFRGASSVSGAQLYNAVSDLSLSSVAAGGMSATMENASRQSINILGKQIAGNPKAVEEMLKVIAVAFKSAGQVITKETALRVLDEAVATGVIRGVADPLQTAVPIIYRSPKDYPTLHEYVQSAVHGVVSGMAMGAILGSTMEASTSSYRLGYRRFNNAVDVAMVKDGEGSMSFAEVVGATRDAKGAIKTLDIIIDGRVVSVDSKAVLNVVRISPKEVASAESAYQEGSANEYGKVAGLLTYNGGKGRVSEGVTPPSPQEIENVLPGTITTDRPDLDIKVQYSRAVEKYKEVFGEEPSDEINGKWLADRVADGSLSSEQMGVVYQFVQAKAAVAGLIESQRSADHNAYVESIMNQVKSDSNPEGKFWHKKDGEVVVRQLARPDGTVGYVLGEIDGSLTIQWTNGQNSVSPRSQIEAWKRLGSITSDTTLPIREFVENGTIEKKAQAERARLYEEGVEAIRNVQNAIVTEAKANAGFINIGTPEVPVMAKISKEQLNPNVLAVEGKDSSGRPFARELTWKEIGDIKGMRTEGITDAELESAQMTELLAQYGDKDVNPIMPYINSLAMQGLEDPNVPRDFRGGKLPVNEDGSVNVIALWNNDPVAWAMHATTERGDGGSRAFARFNKAISTLESQIAQNDKAIMEDPNLGLAEEEALEIKNAELKKRLDEVRNGKEEFLDLQFGKQTPIFEEQYRKASLPEKLRIAQDYLDLLDGHPAQRRAFVLSYGNYKAEMKAAGVDDRGIAEVSQGIDDAIKASSAVDGFLSDGRIFVFPEALPTLVRVSDKYVHERDHYLHKSDRATIDAIMEVSEPMALRDAVRKLSDSNFYDNMGPSVWADEVSAYIKEVAYEGGDIAEVVEAVGLNEEVTKIIQDEFNRESNDRSLSRAKRNILQPSGTESGSGYGWANKIGRWRLEKQRNGVAQRSQEASGSPAGQQPAGAEPKQVDSISEAVSADESAVDLGSFSITTEDALRNAILNFADSKEADRLKWASGQIGSIVEETSDLLNFIHSNIEGNPDYDAFAQKDPTLRVDWRDGVEKPVVTWVRNNIEYKYDMSADTFCINNEGLETVLASPVMADLMVHLAEYNYDPKGKEEGHRSGFKSDDYLLLYETLRDMGFVVPCKGCFDAAARFKMLPSVAQTFVDLVNKAVDERNANPEAFDASVLELGSAKVVDGVAVSATSKADAIRVGVAGDKLAEHIDWTQLMSAKGQTQALSDWGGIFRAWQKTGAGRPKDKLMPEPYTGQIMNTATTIIAPYGEKTPAFRDLEVNQGTGLRRNSHSEYRPTLVIDEMQFVRDAWLKKLCVFKYMKELDDVRLFGNFGIKFNMSAFAAWHKDGVAAGLDKDGNYAIAEESVGGREYPYQGEDGRTHYDGYKGLEEAKRHINKDCSLSSVAFSMPHLMKLMTDVPTPSDKSGDYGSLIPFHASGATQGSLAKQGLGMARGINSGKFMEEAFTDYDKGVTNFEDVQNDRFGEGWVVIAGKDAGKVATGHKLEYPKASVLRNEDLGVRYYMSKDAYVSFFGLGKGAKPFAEYDFSGAFYTLDVEENKIPHPLAVDYNDKVREIGSDYAYKEAADYYVNELRGIGFLPRFDFVVPKEKYLEFCQVAKIDPNHPKLGWKGGDWSPCDAESYYSLFCDYGMTDPATGKLSPHRPVLEGQTAPDSFRKALPENYLDVIKEGLDRYTKRTEQEASMINNAIAEFCRREIELGRMDSAVADEIMKAHNGEIKANAPIESSSVTTSKTNFSVTDADKLIAFASGRTAEEVARERIAANDALMDTEANEMADASVRFSVRTKPAPEKTGIGYKVFFMKDGKLYPPMVANPNGADTPVGTWLDADAAPIAGESKTGRPQVKAGGKGTQGGSGQLAYRPGWHLGEIPYAIQFNRKDENGERTLFPKDFVWAEVEYAMDNDYQQEAEAEGMTDNGSYRHSYAGLKRVPEDGFYKYRTNPNPDTDPWIITGAMKVNKVLTREEVDDLVRKAGREPQRVEGETRFSVVDITKMTDEEKQERASSLGNSKVISMPKTDFVDDENGKAYKKAQQWAKDNIKPTTYKTEVGDVLIDAKSVKSSVGHPVLFQERLDATKTIIEGFQNAVYLGSLEDLDGNPIMNHYFAYRVQQDGKYGYVFCRAREDNNMNRLYVHDFFYEPEIKTASLKPLAGAKKDELQRGRSLYKQILADIVNSKGTQSFGNSNSKEQKRDAMFSVTPRTEEQKQKLFDAAKETYGTTNNYKVAGYLLPDGALLDFSGKWEGGDPNMRQTDHRDIHYAMHAAGEETNHEYPTQRIVDFLSTGAIRVEPEISAVNLMVEPTKEQYDQIRNFLYATNKMGMAIEIDGEDGSTAAFAEYSQRTSPTRVINDIKKYFKDGTQPVGNTTSFSVANENQRIFVSAAEQAMDKIPMKSGNAQAWINKLTQQGGLKKDEDKWLGLSDWLKEQDDNISREDVLNFIHENQVQIEEVHYGDTSTSDIFGNWERDGQGYRNTVDRKMFIKDGSNEAIYNGESIGFFDDFDEAENALITHVGEVDRPINPTRMDYTTRGLNNNREIALTVPTIEPYNAGDKIHFGDAGEGRAVAWIRFGETEDAEGNRALVIDEIQSKRHQDGKTKGYADDKLAPAGLHMVYSQNGLYRFADADGNLMARNEKEVGKFDELFNATYVAPTSEQQDAMHEYRQENGFVTNGVSLEKKKVPDAPFANNWHELAFKRMLRLAAEEGYDKIAWTTGDQQADRYKQRHYVDFIELLREENGNRVYEVNGKGSVDKITVNTDGKVVSTDFIVEPGSPLAQVVGREVAQQMSALVLSENEDSNILEVNGIVGGDGMRNFYDERLVNFANKYAKKWGTSVQDIELPNLEESARTMHAIDITPEMKESVMQGQTMFSVIGERGAATDKSEEGMKRLANLDIAREMESKLNPDWSAKDDGNALKIKVATGWERGADGKWRYEVGDAKFKEGVFSKRWGKTLSSVIDAPEVFALYPELADLKIKRLNSSTTAGTFSERDKLMTVNTALIKWAMDDMSQIENYYGTDAPELAEHERYNRRKADLQKYIEWAEETLNHELQHAIQWKEGFARGGNSSMSYNGRVLGEKGYHNLAGEVESRNVADRLKMTMEERRNSLLSSTEDVAREDQIFIMDAFAVAGSKENANFAITGFPDRAEGEDVTDYLKGALGNWMSNYRSLSSIIIRHDRKPGDTNAYYDDRVKKLFFFADEDVKSYDELEALLFHENYHNYLRLHPEIDPSAIGKKLFELGYFEMTEEEFKQQLRDLGYYSENEIPEEISAYAVGTLSLYGDAYQIIRENPDDETLQQLSEFFKAIKYELPTEYITRMGETQGEEGEDRGSVGERKGDFVPRDNGQNQTETQTYDDGSEGSRISRGRFSVANNPQSAFSALPEDMQREAWNEAMRTDLNVPAATERVIAKAEAEGNTEVIDAVAKAIADNVPAESARFSVVSAEEADKFNERAQATAGLNTDISKAEIKEQPIKLNGFGRFTLKSAFKGIKVGDNKTINYVKVEINPHATEPLVSFDPAIGGFGVISVPADYVNEVGNDMFIDPTKIEKELKWMLLQATDNTNDKWGYLTSADRQKGTIPATEARFSIGVPYEETEPFRTMIQDAQAKVNANGIAGLMNEKETRSIEEFTRDLLEPVFVPDDSKVEIAASFVEKDNLSQGGEDILRQVGENIQNYLGVKMTDEDIRWMLYNMQHYNDESIMDKAHNISVARKFGYAKPAYTPAEVDLATALAQAEEANADIKKMHSAMQKVTKTLNDIRRAMEVRQDFDQSTIDRIVNLSHLLLQEHVLDAMTDGQVKRLQSFIRNASGKSRINSDVQKLFSLILDNQTMRVEKLFDKIVSIKAERVNSSGVAVQGALDLQGQVVFKAFKENMISDKAAIEDRLAEVEENLSSDNTLVKDNAQLEHIGLSYAKMYREQIVDTKSNISDLRKEIRDYDENNAELGALAESAKAEFIKESYNAINKLRTERLQSLIELSQGLMDLATASHSKAREFKQKDFERIQDIHHNANSDMEGVPTDLIIPETNAMKVFNKLNNGFAKSLLLPLATPDQMFRAFGSKAVNGEGYLWDRYIRGWVDCAGKLYTDVQADRAALDDKVAELFGDGKQWRDLHDIEDKIGEATIEVVDGENIKNISLPQGNLLYIYMVNKMSDGRMKLRKMGITEQTVKQIEGQMDSRLLALADWVQEEFLPKKREEFNETHKRLFGAPMAAVENYFPLVINKKTVRKNEDSSTGSIDNGMSSTVTGSIKRRVVNTKPIDIVKANVFDVLLNHVDQMEDWNAFAEYRRDLNTLRNYNHFRNQIENTHTVYGTGAVALQNFQKICDILGGGYKTDRSWGDEAVAKISSGVTGAAITLRYFTAWKQLFSLPAFHANADSSKFYKNVVHPVSCWNWAMENLPLARKRWESKHAGDNKLDPAMDDFSRFKEGIGKKIAEWGMKPNAFFDMLAVSIGAKSIYETTYSRYIEAGYLPEKARAKALQDATILYNESQQSNEAPFLSPLQMDTSVISSVLTLFRNSSMGYFRQAHDARRSLLRMIQPGYKENSIEFMTKKFIREGLSEFDAANNAEYTYKKQAMQNVTRIAIYDFILAAFWNLAKTSLSFLIGLLLDSDKDEDQKDNLLKSLLADTLVGPLQGLPAGAQMTALLSTLIAKGKIDKNAEFFPELPISNEVENATRKFANDRDLEAMHNLANIVVSSGIGVSPQTVEEQVMAVFEACKGDLGLMNESVIAALKFINAPQGVIKEAYYEGLDNDNMLFSDVATRYAEYQLKRNAGIMSMFYTDFKETDVLNSYYQRFMDYTKERMSPSVDKIDALYNGLATYTEEKSKEIDDLRKAVKENGDMDAARKLQEFYASPDYLPMKAYQEADKALSEKIKEFFVASTYENKIDILNEANKMKADLYKSLDYNDGSEFYYENAYKKYTTGLFPTMRLLEEHYKVKDQEPEEYMPFEIFNSPEYQAYYKVRDDLNKRSTKNTPNVEINDLDKEIREAKESGDTRKVKSLEKERAEALKKWIDSLEN